MCKYLVKLDLTTSELGLRSMRGTPVGDSLKFRLLVRIFIKFCEKKADLIIFRVYASS